MSTHAASRRSLLLALFAAATLGLLAFVALAVHAIGRLTDWSSATLDRASRAAAAVVAPLRDDVERAVGDTRQAVAESAAQLNAMSEQAESDLREATSLVAEVKAIAARAATDSEALLRDVTHVATQEASRATLAAASALAGRAESGSGSNDAAARAAPAHHPQAWPHDPALEQVSFRRDGQMREFSYRVADPEFQLDTLRRRLVEAGYAERVVRETPHDLEAIYTNQRQLVLTARTRSGRPQIDVRELPLDRDATPGP